MSAARRAAEAFAREHGRAPRALWSAPGRVNLIGEHTDYNDGFVLPFALPHRTAVAAAPRADRVLAPATLGDDQSLHRGAQLPLDELAPGSTSGWTSYPAGVAWALREAGIDLPGVDLVIVGEVPTGAGLSSSHALECAVALALLDLAGRPADGPRAARTAEVARWVQRAENEFAGAPTGILDQTASLGCAAEHALFYDVRSGESEQIPFDSRASGLEVLVIDTRANHSHSTSGYGDRRRGCEQAAELLGVDALRDVSGQELDVALDKLPEQLRPLVRHVVTENERVLAAVADLRAGDVAAVGPRLTASHTSLRDDYRVSCPELDVAVESALATGALGARMTGGGFGGSAIALVHADQRPQVERAVRESFAEHGMDSPRLFTAVPAAGAGREQE